MPKGSDHRPPDPEVVADMFPRLGWMHGVLAFVLRDSFKANA